MAAPKKEKRASFSKSSYSGYLSQLKSLQYRDLSCGTCAFTTKSPNGSDAFCNFCESYTSAILPPKIPLEARPVLEKIHSLMGDNRLDEAASALEILLKDSKNPTLFYVAANFYLNFSDITYYSRNYNIMGFMEENAISIRKSLDLTAKWKECLYKSIRLVKGQAAEISTAGESLLFIKFMSEIRLSRFVDSGRTLKSLAQYGLGDLTVTYANMVYGVEAGKDPSQYFNAFLSRQEPNAYYYLAKYLAKSKRLDEAESVLSKLSSKAKVRMLPSLLNKIVSSERAADPEHSNPLSRP